MYTHSKIVIDLCLCVYIDMCTYHIPYMFPRSVHLTGSTCNDTLLAMSTL